MNHWIYVDIGNTAIKYSVGSSLQLAESDHCGRVMLSRNSPLNSLTDFHLQPDATYNWASSSVNRTATLQLKELISHHRAEDQFFQIEHQHLDLEVIPQPSERVGIDRLVAAQAAIEITLRDSAKHNVIIIDAGTAVTIDAANRNRQFLGGTIRPGIQLQRAALHNYTDALPDLSTSKRFVSDHQALGTSTEDAIISGTGFGELGAIMAIVQLLEDQLESAATVILTGGSAEWMLDFIPDEWEFIPGLVLHGVELISRKVFS